MASWQAMRACALAWGSRFTRCVGGATATVYIDRTRHGGDRGSAHTCIRSSLHCILPPCRCAVAFCSVGVA
jgi:hypothetical protein